MSSLHSRQCSQKRPHSSPFSTIVVPVSFSMEKILVFVVRHGEREDEALYYTGNRTAYKKLNLEDKLDPYLSVKGHRQAGAALENLVSALTAAHIERAVIFSSPMRRALGTIMMLASAMGTVQGGGHARTMNGEREKVDYTGVSFALPSMDNGKEDKVEDGRPTRDVENGVRGTQIIPVVVHNGLCQCTALVGRLGGHDNVVRAGLIRCAAKEENSVLNKQSPIRKELDEMKSRAVEALEGDSGLSGAPLQFCKIQDEKLLPMTPPIHLNRRDLQEEEQYEDKQCEMMSCPAGLDVFSEPPIDQVVRMAMKAGFHACVVSSHREEIRDLVEKRCKSYYDVDHIPYCAIGIFEAWIDGSCVAENDDIDQNVESRQQLQWALHNIAAPGNMHNLFVSDMLLRPNKVSSKPVEIFWPVIERTMLCLCKGKLILDEIAVESSVTGIHSCTLTGATREIPKEFNETTHQPFPLTLTIEISEGRHSWLQFLRRLRDDVAHGTIELEKVNSTVLSKFLVLLRPDRQPKLPCPPKVIHLDVLV